jgi:predicted dehydrogenase
VTSIAIIGSGSAGRRHLDAVRALHPDARVVVVRRPESSRPADQLISRRATVVPSLDQALQPPPDLGIVAGPAPFHRAAAEQLLAAGAHVLVEKPIAASVEDGWAMARAAARHDRSLVVGYHLRFSATPETMFRFLAEGAIGRPVSFDLRVGQHLDQWRPDVAPEHSVTARAELGGGVLLELSHELDAAIRIAGPIDEVRAELRFDGAPTDGTVETVADLRLEARSGVQGRVHLDMVAPRPFRTWTVVGTAGTVSADLWARRVLLQRPHLVDEVVESGPDERDGAARRLLGHLCAVAAGTAQPRCTAADGIAVLELVEAARSSHERGIPVPVGRGRP